MGILEKVLLILFALIVLVCLYFIFFSKKKSKGKKEKKEKKSNRKKKEEAPAGERKVERVIKKQGEEDKEDTKEDSNKDSEEKVLEKEPPKDTSFKIIRKQSEVKINKKALKSGSRNPSITKVFDKNGKMIDPDNNTDSVNVLQEEVDSDMIDIIREFDAEENSIMSGTPFGNIGAFGFREYNMNEVSTDKEFKINAPIGSPNRAPIIGDRTNFASHLNVSEDGNLSGVVGTGVSKIIQRAESQTDEIEKKTNDMLDNIRKNILGNRGFGFGNNPFSQVKTEQKEEPKKKRTIKDIDAKTLIIAEAINNPKNRKSQN